MRRRIRHWRSIVAACVFVSAVCGGLVVLMSLDDPILDVRDFGAKGDWMADDTAAIEACITTAAYEDKEVYISPGTYRIVGGISLPTGDAEYDNLVIRGAGMGETVLTMDTQPESRYIFTAGDLSRLTISDLTFHTTSAPYPTNVRALLCTGMRESTVSRVRVENCDYGLKLGSGGQAHGLLVEDIQTRNIGTLSLQVIDVSDSVFRHLDLENRTDTGEGMCVYIERDNHNLTFENLRCVGGSRNCMQLWNEDDADPSDHIAFINTYLDNRGGPKYPFTVDGDFSDITFTHTVILANRSENPCIVWYGGTRIVFDGITASGGAALHMRYGGDPVGCAISNGTYQGPAIGYVEGVQVTNVSASQVASRP